MGGERVTERTLVVFCSSDVTGNATRTAHGEREVRIT
jgi:hypothetical protein